jgi:adenylate kinase family enzyme
MNTRPIRRIVIHGHSGSGKSTLARIIGARLKLTIIDLDALYHVKNWDDTPMNEFRAKIEQAKDSSPDGWVSAGNYSRVKDLLMDQADTVIWLRLPFHIVYRRLFWRTIRDLITRKPVWKGTELKESWRQTFTTRDSILLWGIKNWNPHIRKMNKALDTAPKELNIEVLRSPRDVDQFIEQLPLIMENSSDG